MSERIYRDPVHNIIRLQTDTSEGELMMKLIDASEFQRLRRASRAAPLVKRPTIDIAVAVNFIEH